jgi:2-haloacid dehalogenase
MPPARCLIACHVWDTIGAQSAGWQAGLILRRGNAPLDVGPQPDYIGKDLNAIAEQLIDKHGWPDLGDWRPPGGNQSR